MARKKRSNSQSDPIEAAVKALRTLTGETDDEWPDDLRDLKPVGKKDQSKRKADPDDRT